MSRPLVKERDERELRRLRSNLSNTAKKSAAKSIAISKKDARNIVDLIGTILDAKPIVVDSYLTPNEAAKLSNVSRPLIIEKLKRGTLIGHMVGKHWRVQKESLLDYIANRDKTTRLMNKLDEEGLAFDE